MWATDATGSFTDEWTMGGDGYLPQGCGFAVNYDHWQLCGLTNPESGSGNVGLTFATVTGFMHNNQIGIFSGLGTWVLPPFTAPCKPDTKNCPGSLPTGTGFEP
jgi:hypothetical protein